MAPANKRKLSIIWSSTAWKSIRLIAFVVCKKNVGKTIPKIITISEARREISIMPIVEGSLVNRILM